jgi:transposase
MKKQHVTLNETDRTYLENLISKGSLPAKTYKRALALLELDRSSTFTNVAQIVGVTHQTASNWAQKYGESGLSFLNDKPRSGRPREIDGITRAQITASWPASAKLFM